MLLLKFFLRLHRVAAHPHDHQPQCTEVRRGIPQRTGLRGAAGRTGLGIKINQRDSLGVIIGEFLRLSILIHNFKVRRGCTHFQRIGLGENGKQESKK